MGKIYCVMGKSSSGKDSIYHQIMGKGVLALKPIIPYTTRPIRDGEQDGREYHFCTEETVQKLQDAGRIIELRAIPYMECGSISRSMMSGSIWRTIIICIL